ALEDQLDSRRAAVDTHELPALGAEVVDLLLVDLVTVLDSVLPAVRGHAADALMRPAPAPLPTGRFRADCEWAEHVEDLGAHALGVGAEIEHDPRGHAFVLADEAEQDVLGADVVVSDREGFAQRELEHLLCAGRERDLAD